MPVRPRPSFGEHSEGADHQQHHQHPHGDHDEEEDDGRPSKKLLVAPLPPAFLAGAATVPDPPACHMAVEPPLPPAVASASAASIAASASSAGAAAPAAAAAIASPLDQPHACNPPKQPTTRTVVVAGMSPASFKVCYVWMCRLCSHASHVDRFAPRRLPQSINGSVGRSIDLFRHPYLTTGRAGSHLAKAFEPQGAHGLDQQARPTPALARRLGLARGAPLRGRGAVGGGGDAFLRRRCCCCCFDMAVRGV